MAEVYWIRKAEHNDIFSQGYVGVTSKTAQERFQSHIKTSRVKSSKKTILNKVISSLGWENLVCETVCICELDYAFWLERKLRPEKMIGWNQNIGGDAPPNMKGRKFTEQHKKNMSNALKGVPASELKLQKIQEIADRKRGKPRPDGATDKQKQTIEKKGPWGNPAAKDNLHLWARADEFYQFYINGRGSVFTENANNLPRSSLTGIFKNFKRGWIPIDDPRWVSKFKKEAA